MPSIFVNLVDDEYLRGSTYIHTYILKQIMKRKRMKPRRVPSLQTNERASRCSGRVRRHKANSNISNMRSV